MKRAFVISSFILVGLLVFGGIFWITRGGQQEKPAKKTEQQAPLFKVVLAYSFTKANQMPVAVALKKGLFKKYNLDVEIKQVDKNVTSVLVANQADIMLVTPNIALPAVVEGAKLLWIGSINQDSSTVVVSSKDAKNIKTFGVFSGPSRVQTIGLLDLLGIDTKNITTQQLSDNSTKLAALKEKQVDAIHIAKPDWLIFQKKAGLSNEYKILLDSTTEEQAQMPIGIIVREDFLEKNKEEVANFTKALIEANYWIQNNKEEFFPLIEAYFTDLPKEDAAIQAQTYLDTLSGLEFTPTEKTGQRMLKLVEASNPKATGYDLKNFVSTTVTDSLDQSGFLQQFEIK